MKMLRGSEPVRGREQRSLAIADECPDIGGSGRRCPCRPTTSRRFLVSNQVQTNVSQAPSLLQSALSRQRLRAAVRTSPRAAGLCKAIVGGETNGLDGDSGCDAQRRQG